MNHTAVILCQSEIGSLQIAALPLLDRLVVAAHRAECSVITVVCVGPLPRLKRAPALGISVHTTSSRPTLASPTLVIDGRVLVQAVDLRQLLAQNGRLVRPDNTPLPVGVLDTWPDSLPVACDSLPRVVANGVAEPVFDEASAREAEKALWNSLGSSSDGFVDRYFNRPVGRHFSKLLIHTSVTPNQVSAFATLLGLASAWCFLAGSPFRDLAGALLLQASAIVDCVDGDLARVLFKESRLGKWLDIVGDQVVHFSVFVAIGIGLHRAGSDAPVLALATSAGVGAVIAFAVVLRGLLRPDLLRSTKLQKFVDATTNRDFSVLLLLLVATHCLEWFLWLAAIGVHLFWITALVLQSGASVASKRMRQSP